MVIAVSLTGDWSFVVVTLAELGATVAPFVAARLATPCYLVIMACGLLFLSRHDTESGHWPLLMALAAGGVASAIGLRTPPSGWAFPRRRVVMSLAWAVPVLALLAGLIPSEHPLARAPWIRGLVERCRFTAVPIDDIERLAVWCREHTPTSARFIGPPGPKTFRLWSRRNLAFNRASSPYHAAGLADWFARFQDHVGHRGTPSEFVHDYLAGRHRLESRYDAMNDRERVSLAIRQGADYVIAASPVSPRSVQPPGQRPGRDSPLEFLHADGRYAVYRVRPELLSTASAIGSEGGE